MPTRPANYLGWVPSGSPAAIQQPPASLCATGYTQGQSPVFGHYNYGLWLLDNWVQYLDNVSSISNAASSLFESMRLLGGGNFSFNAASSAFTWTSQIVIAMPGTADSNNTVAAGSVPLSAGQIAYVNANIPINATGNTTNLSTSVTGISYGLGIVSGQGVTGQGIAAGTTVTAITGTTVTLSQAATATATAVVLTFTGSGALTVQTAMSSTFTPAANTVIIARRSGSTLYVGINASTMLLRDGESKLLLDNGYTGVFSATAGAALTQGQAVYISAGAAAGDTGRTSGLVYPVDASAALGATRTNFIGFVMTSTAQGGLVPIVTDGVFGALTGLTLGQLVYADPANPGGYTQTKPITVGQYLVPVGVAISATQVDINAAQGATTTQVASLAPWPQYSAGSEAQFNSAIAQCTAAGGGVILISGPFTIVGTPTLTSGIKVKGRGQAAVITVSGASASLTVAGDDCKIEDVAFAGDATCIAMVQLTGQRNDVLDCSFTPAPTVGTSCLASYKFAVQCRSVRNRFYGVLQSNAIGIAATSGEIADTDSVFTVN